MPASRWAKLKAELSLPQIPDSLLQQAFQHGSYVEEKGLPQIASNQRLEFLGDVVLDLIVAEELYRNRPEALEGQLTRRKAAAVRSGALARVALKMNLGDYLLLSRGEEDSGGRAKPSLLADALEALVGALYLATDLDSVRTFLLPYLNLEDVPDSTVDFDHKTALQELVQGRAKQLPVYVLLSAEGPAHRLKFTIEARFAGHPIGRGSGGSKRAAEQAAAGEALRTVGDWLSKLAPDAP
jgi:ribonuclease III